VRHLEAATAGDVALRGEDRERVSLRAGQVSDRPVLAAVLVEQRLRVGNLVV
jgi:hypothetical protein